MVKDTSKLKAVKFAMPRISDGLPIRLAYLEDGGGRLEAWLHGKWTIGHCDFSDWFTATCVSPEELDRLGVPYHRSEGHDYLRGLGQ